jgi:DNA mismatch endonuclease (patch repair protein)
MVSTEKCGSASARPAAKSPLVSAQMSRMPRASSGPELALRRALHARGLRFTIHRRDLPGTPDVVFSAARLAIFVDGCFWHGCVEHGTLPKNNRDWWMQKLRANTERDLRKDAQLIERGWLPLHLWEHVPPEEAADAVLALWRHRTGRA